jgi:hypothetical protein
MVQVQTIQGVYKAEMAMKAWSSGDPALSRYRHDVNIAHKTQLVMRITSMVKVETIRHCVNIANITMETWSSEDPAWSRYRQSDMVLIPWTWPYQTWSSGN